jgi:decaprenylphospho-beta-D-erythro-pentofuranosid-2-ulose 2-reductase
MKNILIIGATSAIAEATARIFAQRGANLYLLARNNERLASMCQDLRQRGAKGTCFAVLDANDIDRHEAVLNEAIATLGSIDIVLIAHGTLSDQAACESDVALTLSEINTNALSSIALLTQLANTLQAQGHGTLAVISSVAGDRGRQSNYVYGCAKAMLNTFLQGLRNRLHADGIQVLTIKPGFVNSPMTAEFDKGLLWAEPETIASGIVKAIDKGKHEVYLPFFWRYIMLLIRQLPERLFVRLSL